MSARESAEKDACPTCGPTNTERHPRRPDVTRCANCKEWLHVNAEKDVHLSYRLGGCATDTHPTAVTDAAAAGRVTCPICLPAARVIPPGTTEVDA